MDPLEGVGSLFSGGARPGDEAVGCREELLAVKEALHAVMSGAGAEALESRYLAQIKRNKSLVVQLNAEKSKTTQLEKVLHEEQRKNAALVEKAKQLAAKAKGGAGRPLEMRDIIPDIVTDRALEKMGGRASRSSSATQDDGDGTQQQQQQQSESVKQLRERADRCYRVISEKDSVIAEYKKEVQRWRALLQRETGVANDSLTLESMETKEGWKGRAHTIVLLQGKVKDLEEALRSSGSNPQQPVNLDGKQPPLPSPPRRSGSEGSSNEGAVVKDVDTEARQCVALMGQRRVQQMKELEREKDAAVDALTDEKRRYVALQARLTASQRESQQLKDNVRTMIEKSVGDDELIAAYREELTALQEDMRELKAWNSELEGAEGGGGGRPHHAPAGAKQQQPPIRCKAKHRRGSVRDDEEEEERDTFFSYLKQRLAGQMTIEAEEAGSPPPVNGGSLLLSQVVLRDIEDVLSNAFEYVKAAEQSAFAQDEEWSAVYQVYHELLTAVQESRGAAVKELSRKVHALPPLEKVLEEENRQLKARLTQLSELLDRSNALREAGWAVRSDHHQQQQQTGKRNGAPLDDDGREAGTSDAALQAQYLKLEKDYKELRKEFNRMQLKETPSFK